jgi:hypothetical protein
VKLIVNKKSTSRGKRGMGPKAWDMEDAKWKMIERLFVYTCTHNNHYH